MKEKCVIVTDSTLSLGLQVNAAAILGISLGARAAGQAAGVLLVGPEKTIRKLTGSLPLLK